MLTDENQDDGRGKERQAYIDQWWSDARENPPTPTAQRLHKLMAKYDLDVEIASTELRSKIQDGPLDAKTIELLYIIGYTIRGFDAKNIAWHTRAALRAGATAAEILHAIELLLTIDGVIPFMRALDAWADVTGVEGIEPTSNG